MAVIDASGRLCVWARGDERPRVAVDAHAEGARIAWLPDGRLLSCGGRVDPTLALWEGARCLARFGGYTGLRIYDLLVTADGRRVLAAGFGDVAITEWDLLAR